MEDGRGRTGGVAKIALRTYAGLLGTWLAYTVTWH